MGLDGPLGVFADAVLGKMLEIEAAEAAYLKALGARVEHLIGATVAVNPALPHPTFNQALALDAEAQDLTAFVRRIELLFDKEGVPFEFVVTPVSRPADLELTIAAHGYATVSRRTWMELMVPAPTAPDDPRIQIFVPQEPYGWADTVAEGQGALDARGLLGRLAEITMRTRNHTLLSATYEGQAAGGCEVSVDDGICVVRRLAVKPAFRPREVTRALLHTACEYAYAHDAFRIIVRVFQGSGAEPLFESYGFVGMQISEELVREFPPFVLD